MKRLLARLASWFTHRNDLYVSTGVSMHTRLYHLERSKGFTE